MRRVPGGRGRSVFAYRSEIDAWLAAAGGQQSTAEPPAVDPPSGMEPEPGRRSTRVRGLIAAAVAALLVIVGIAMSRTRPPAPPLRLDVNPDGIVAIDAAGSPQWRHEFPAAYQTVLSQVANSWQITSGAHPGIFAATSNRYRRADRVVEGGELLAFDTRGAVTRRFSFEDDLKFGDRSFAAPWCITAFSVDPGSGRIAIAAHHYLWGASLVTVLDEQFQRHGTYVQEGWIEAVHWLSADRLLIGGFHEGRNGGMIGLLDPAALDAQAPEPAGSPHRCTNCGSGTPLRLIVMPRTEINITTGSRFNRAVVEVLSDRVVARTIETLSTPADAVDVLYEFSPALDLRRASFSGRYWETHAALSAQKKLAHDANACPDRAGPREVTVWDPATGWRAIHAS